MSVRRWPSGLSPRPILRTARCFGGESGHGFLGLQKPQGTGNPGKLWRKYDTHKTIRLLGSRHVGYGYTVFMAMT